MPTQTSNNKRIAKNTLMLYIRMLVTMGIALFTSRVILQTLGVEDYGIYSVVGSVVSMFTFLNGGMIASTQRFLTFELGRNNDQQLAKVFSSALQIHTLLALVVVVASESIGLWFLYEKMIIPEGRFNAAFWVFQFSIIGCVINIMIVPFNADIVAHEKMSAFAYISVIEVTLKLLVVYLLCLSPFDKLIVYAALLLLVQLLISCIYIRYCGKNFQETKYRHTVDYSLLKEMSSFAGWGFFGSLATLLYTQGLNLLLNVFFGAVVNAARGIAVQVQSAVTGFVSNFQMALNPQITKNYATGNLPQMHSLMFRSARFSFFLLFLLTLPIILETKYILTLWLGVMPPEAIIFTQWILALSLLYPLSNPCVIANQATGKVKNYQMVVGGLLLSVVPVSYIVLLLGAPAYAVFVVNFCIECIALFSRMYMLRNLINLPFIQYLKNTIYPVIVVAILSSIAPLYVHYLVVDDIERLLGVCLTSLLSISTIVFLFGLTKHERQLILTKLKSFKAR